MNNTRNTVERAYELARSGECANVAEIRTRLKAEGYTAVQRHLEGTAIQHALAALCSAARKG